MQEITANQAVWTIFSNDGDMLYLREEQYGMGFNWPVPKNHWLIVEPEFGIRGTSTDAKFVKDYRTMEWIASEVARILDLPTQ